MHHRVGSLHLHYRVRDGSLSALTPSLDRAIQSGLADALDARMSAMLGDDSSVIVVRELKTNVTLAAHDAMLDRRVVDRVSASSVDALVNTLSRDASSDSLVRFADEAEFVGSFIIDLLAGHAWDHWYYGAFLRHRRATARETVREAVAQSTEPARVLAWLARRGRLDRVLELLGGEELLPIVAPSHRPQQSTTFDGAEPLADAAIQILATLGVQDLAISRDELLRRYNTTAPIVADWRDRRSLSAEVLQLIRFVLKRISTARVASLAVSDTLRSLLSGGALDWLDGPWLIARLEEETGPHAEERREYAGAARSLLTPQQSRVLETIANRLREGGYRITADQDETEIKVRLIAAASEQLVSGDTLDRALLVAIEDIAHAYKLPTRVPTDHQIESATKDAPDTTAPEPKIARARTNALQPQALDRYGKAATDLLEALTTPRDAVDPPLEITQAGGLFLLLRALMDMRLPGLARQFDVPLPSLLGAFAIKWFDIDQPFDAAASLWAGAERPDFGMLDSARGRLDDLNDALLDALIVRHGIDERTMRESIESDSLLLSTPLPCSSALNAAIGRAASTLMRAWAFWLRGVSNSSTPFLLDNCLRRAARVRVSPERIDVNLDSAPLDVVLKMAGYFDRIDRVPWLDNRCVTFSVRRAP